MKINYHIHTVFSDGSSSITDYCKTAIQRGFEEIAFTDHLTVFPDGSTETHSLNTLKIEDYVREVKAASGKYRDRVTIRLGVEVDYIPGNEEIVERILKNYDFDLVIGSVHFVDSICIDSSRQRALVEKMVRENGFDSLYSKYLRLVGMAVETGFFDIVGHMDLVKIWGFTPADGFEDEQKALELIKERKLCLEVSSRGLRQPVSSIYPSPRILKRACELGIPITIGTDAHSIGEIDYAYNVLIEYIRTIGYEHITTFSKRRPLEKKVE
ncbi:MAG: histidinol-phosphatase [Candidatus Brockarchaeota archaeon]|nr:histidinol-phosphatase [Candidatus Brockarchaeota archaeon]